MWLDEKKHVNFPQTFFFQTLCSEVQKISTFKFLLHVAASTNIFARDVGRWKKKN